MQKLRRECNSLSRLPRQLHAQTSIGVLHDFKKGICRATGREKDREYAGITECEDDRLSAVGFARRAVAGARVRKAELWRDGRREVALLVSNQAHGKRHAFGGGSHRDLHAQRELRAGDCGIRDRHRLVALRPCDGRAADIR